MSRAWATGSAGRAWGRNGVEGRLGSNTEGLQCHTLEFELCLIIEWESPKLLARGWRGKSRFGDVEVRASGQEPREGQWYRQRVVPQKGGCGFEEKG